MQSSRPLQPERGILHSERLLGLQAECPVCSGPEKSTGWLLEREGENSCWYIELKCADCGSRGGTWRLEWMPLIQDVLKAAGLS